MHEVVAKEAFISAPAVARAPVQRRGQQRVDAILDAAEAVFGEVGVEAATTNAIAERAGASVGSMYHFFANKDAILCALAERYAETMTKVLQRERRLAEPWVPLRELFTSMVASFSAVDFIHPGYMAVCRATDFAYGGNSPVSLQTEAQMQAMVQELLQQRCPRMPDAETRVHAALSCVSMHAALDRIHSVPEADRSAHQSALVDMMVSYFTSVEARYPRPAAP